MIDMPMIGSSVFSMCTECASVCTVWCHHDYSCARVRVEGGREGGREGGGGGGSSSLEEQILEHGLNLNRS